MINLKTRQRNRYDSNGPEAFLVYKCISFQVSLVQLNLIYDPLKTCAENTKILVHITNLYCADNAKHCLNVY